MLQRGRDVDLFGTLGHAVEDHIDETISARAANTITAVHYDGARPTAV